ncbi:MAG: hypothetical protein E6J90_46700 [Deltaproteobacteria bacterium]|nr:MAG: hypothetical protein E6J90_46700 [Deltaproteobacteria bacterium]TMQ08966.1 MAG: hypothetical protein E6J91_31800 [Deltaproteobacteria bacterium]
MKILCHVMAGLILIACGGSDGPNFGPETDPTPAQQAAISSTAQDLALMAMADAQGQAAGGAAIGFAFGAQALIANGTAASLSPGLPGAAQIAPAIAALRQAQLVDCEVITSNSIVWNHCTDPDGGFTIDGMMSWSPGHVDIDLQLAGSAQGLQFASSLKGSVTATSSSIKADMTISATVTGNGNNASETLRTQVDVELTSGCISSGTLTITATGSGTGSRNAALQVIWTGCNAFRVRNA